MLNCCRVETASALPTRSPTRPEFFVSVSSSRPLPFLALRLAENTAVYPVQHIPLPCVPHANTSNELRLALTRQHPAKASSYSLHIPSRSAQQGSFIRSRPYLLILHLHLLCEALVPLADAGNCSAASREIVIFGQPFYFHQRGLPEPIVSSVPARLLSMLPADLRSA